MFVHEPPEAFRRLFCFAVCRQIPGRFGLDRSGDLSLANPSTLFLKDCLSVVILT
jgi:hypothetical protein